MYEPYGFSGLVDQNRADTQSGTFAPTMPGYTGLDRMQFADMRTPEDQIHWLYLKIIGYMANAVSPDEMQAALDEAEAKLKEYVDAQDDAIKADVQAKYVYLIDLIHKFGQFAGSVLDPTQGVSWIIDEVLEHVYDFDRTCSLTAADYDAMRLGAKAYDEQGVDARWYDVAGALWFWDNRTAEKTGSAVSFNFLEMLVDKLSGVHVDPVNSIAPKSVSAAPYAVDETAVAIGNNSTAQGANSVALGNGADASEPNTVAVSGSGIERRITGLAAPVNDGDAANKKYVDEHQADLTEVNARIDGVSEDVDTVSAGLTALGTRVSVVESVETQNTKDIATIKGEVAQNTTDIAEAKATLETDGTNIEQLQSDVAALKARPTGTVVNSIAPLRVETLPKAQANAFSSGNNAFSWGYCVAIGQNAKSGSQEKNALGAIAIGSDSKANAQSSVAIGDNSAATENSSVAIGSHAKCEIASSVSLGNDSESSRDLEASFGRAASTELRGFTRFLANVTDPELDQDAATKHYVDAAIAAIPSGSTVNSIAPLTVSAAPTAVEGAIAFGEGSEATESGTVSFGSTNTRRRLVNVAYPAGDNDAATKAYADTVGQDMLSDAIGVTRTLEKNKVDPLQTKVNEQATTIESLNTAVTTLQSAVSTQASTIESLQSQITALSAKITEIDDSWKGQY